MDFDASFEVRYLHRLRFTRDAFGPANPTLARVLEPGAEARLLVIIDRSVHERHEGLAASIERYVEAQGGRMSLCGPPYIVPGGEFIKNDWSQFEGILRHIHEAAMCRHSYLVVIGGGAVLDAVGFAAAIAHRGIRLIRFPSTTLSQADSGVGVKNGVNAFGKKNYLGTFDPPWAVINDERFLETLSDRDWICGFCEAVKVSILKDPRLFDDIDNATRRIRAREMAAARAVLQRSAQLHLQHITSGGDPFETSTARPLDFGHWAAHKLEQLTGYELRHGEAVAIGIALDASYAALMHYWPEADAGRVRRVLGDLGFRLYHEQLENAGLFDGLDEFREHLGGQLTITLPRAIGSSFEVHEINLEQMRGAVRRLAQAAVHPTPQHVT